MIRVKHKGNFNNTERFLKNAKNLKLTPILIKYGVQGVAALRNNTPKDSGDTANSWDYEVLERRNGYRLVWTNKNINEGIPVAILIQYGHGTRSGTFVQGIDFINPAMRPIFDEIAENLWKEVTSL